MEKTKQRGTSWAPHRLHRPSAPPARHGRDKTGLVFVLAARPAFPALLAWCLCCFSAGGERRGGGQRRSLALSALIPPPALLFSSALCLVFEPPSPSPLPSPSSSARLAPSPVMLASSRSSASAVSRAAMVSTWLLFRPAFCARLLAPLLSVPLADRAWASRISARTPPACPPSPPA